MNSNAHMNDMVAQLQSMLQDVEAMASSLGELGEDIGVMTGIPKLSLEQRQTVLEGLPLLTESQLKELNQHDGSCPICFTSYLAILAECEMAEAMDSPAHPIEELGVTRLSQPWQCGHMFCRKDITKWVNSGKDSCPLCRRLLVDPSTLPTPPPPTTTSDTNANPTADTGPTPTPNPNATGNVPSDTPSATEDLGEVNTLDDILRHLNNTESRSVFSGMGVPAFFARFNNRDRDRDDDADRDYGAMYS